MDNELPSLESILGDMVAEAPAAEPEPEAQVTAPEPVQPPAPVAPPVQLDPRHAELAEKEREFQRLRRQIDEERAAVEQRAAELERLRKYEAFERALDEGDPLEAFKLINLDLDKVNQAAVQGRGVRPHRAVEERLQKAIEERTSALQNQLQELQQAEYERKVQAARSEISREVSTRQSFLSELGDLAVDEVMRGFTSHKGDKLPTYDEVIRAVEEQVDSQLKPLFQNEALRKRYGIQPSAQPADKTPSEPKRVTPSKTLSNRDAATVTRRETEQDMNLPSRREDAIDAILARRR